LINTVVIQIDKYYIKITKWLITVELNIGKKDIQEMPNSSIGTNVISH